jgi:hypothetical protein
MSASLSAEGYSELALGSLAVNRPLDGLANGLDDLLAHVAVLGLRPLGRRAHPASSLPGMSAAFHGCSLGWPAASCADGHLCDEVYLVWLRDRRIRAACCCGPPWFSHNLHGGRASSLAQPRSALPPRLSRRCTLETPSRRTSRTARHHLVSPLVAVRRTRSVVSCCLAAVYPRWQPNVASVGWLAAIRVRGMPALSLGALRAIRVLPRRLRVVRRAFCSRPLDWLDWGSRMRETASSRRPDDRTRPSRCKGAASFYP